MMPRQAKFQRRLPWYLALAAAPLWLGLSVQLAAAGREPAPANDPVSLKVDGFAASIGEDDPRVLYILPWQSPSLPRRPRADLDQAAPGLAEPINPMTLERLRVFRQTLDPLTLNPRGN